MFGLKLLAFSLAVYGAFAQVCPQTEVLFVLDFSDTAWYAATSTLSSYYSFDILKSAIDSFLLNSYVANSANDFRVGAIGYGSLGTIEYIPLRSSPSTARQYVYARGNDTLGASLTYIGLRAVMSGPTYTNNRLVLISAQGTSSYNDTLSFYEASRIRNLGWNINVIAVQGRNAMDLYELIGINNNIRPVILNDTTTVGGPKSYRYLVNELSNIVSSLCNLPAYTVCSTCQFEGGFGYESDPRYCDSFYQCVQDSSPIRKMCPAGTFWDGSQCNFINAVRCPNAPCDASTPAGTRYPSGRCCNKYFECSNSQLVEVSCPVGQYFDSGYRQCLTATDSIQVCERTGRFECDVNRNGPISAVRCDGFAPDPFANPCRFQFQGRSMNVAPGTVWNQNKCALEYSNNNVCYNTLINTRLLDLSSTCNAVFLATFNGGSKSVYSERLNANLDIYVLQNQVQLTNDGLLYTSSMSDPFYYFYFFNNREIRPNTAFRIRFRLDNPQFNREYDILSNNYCALCPDTIRFSVSASSSTRRVVSVMFVTPGALVTSTSAIIDLSNVLNLIELVVIFGDRAVYGQLRELNGVNFNNIVQRVDFNSANKVQGSQVATNRCGIQLGRGPNSNFVGIIDDFAVYERCVNINSVLS